jgi:hypothetical protein
MVVLQLDQVHKNTDGVVMAVVERRRRNLLNPIMVLLEISFVNYGNKENTKDRK